MDLKNCKKCGTVINLDDVPSKRAYKVESNTGQHMEGFTCPVCKITNLWGDCLYFDEEKDKEYFDKLFPDGVKIVGEWD